MRDAFRMIRVMFAGQYPGRPWRSIGLLAVLIIYIVSPIDLIPDYIPVVGVIDDLAMVGFFLRALHKDVQRFRAWERLHQQ
jgi:uncharacterized membrane protein YkvA (DUF1232 family)